MKIRADFVTNSSSSSFILAQKGDFSEKQKKAMLDFLFKRMIGMAILTPESTEEEICSAVDDRFIFEDDLEQVRNALKNGKTIYYGAVSFEGPYDDYAELYQELWEKLEESGEGNFEGIDVDLSY